MLGERGDGGKEGWSATAAAVVALAVAATAVTVAAAAPVAGSAVASAVWVEVDLSSGNPGTRGRPALTRRTTQTPA